jgi:hypothetical protein
MYTCSLPFSISSSVKSLLIPLLHSTYSDLYLGEQTGPQFDNIIRTHKPESIELIRPVILSILHDPSGVKWDRPSSPHSRNFLCAELKPTVASHVDVEAHFSPLKYYLQ